MQQGSHIAGVQEPATQWMLLHHERNEAQTLTTMWPNPENTMLVREARPHGCALDPTEMTLGEGDSSPVPSLARHCGGGDASAGLSGLERSHIFGGSLLHKGYTQFIKLNLKKLRHSTRGVCAALPLP